MITCIDSFYLNTDHYEAVRKDPLFSHITEWKILKNGSEVVEEFHTKKKYD